MLSLLQTESEQADVAWAALADDLRSLDALAAAMEIPQGPGRHFLLAWKLARKYEPGFKPKRQNGRPQKWDGFGLLTLANLIALVMHTGCRSKAGACEYLSTNDPWLKKVEGRPDGEALGRQCTKRMLDTARKSLLAAVSAGMLDGYAAEVCRHRDYLAQRAERK